MEARSKVHSRKLTWNLKMMVSNRKLLFQVSIFGCHVSFRGCNHLSHEHQSLQTRRRKKKNWFAPLHVFDTTKNPDSSSMRFPDVRDKYHAYRDVGQHNWMYHHVSIYTPENYRKTLEKHNHEWSYMSCPIQKWWFSSQPCKFSGGYHHLSTYAPTHLFTSDLSIYPSVDIWTHAFTLARFWTEH